MNNKEKVLLWIALAFGAALFFGAIVEGIRHSVKHGTTHPTRTEFNLLIEQNRRLIQRQDSDFVRITTMMQQIVSIQKGDQQYDAVQDDFILDLKTEISRIKNENSK